MASRALIAGLLVVLAATSVAASPSRTAILEPLEITGVVVGDVVVVAADVHLAPTADVRGHVVAVFGQVHREPGARVSGAAVGISSLAGLSLHGDPAGDTDHYQLGARLVVAGLWLTATTLLAVVVPRRMRRGTWMVGVLGLRIVVLGALVLVTAMAALVAAIGLGPTLGVPLAALVMVVFLAAKVVGVAVLGGALGSWLSSRLLRRALPLAWVVLIGVGVLLGLRTIPVVGATVWTVVSVLALGAGVFSVALASTERPVGVSVTSGLPRR